MSARVFSFPAGARLLNLLRADGGRWRLLGLTVAVFVLMSALNPGRFLTVANFESMAFQFPELALLALAILLTMLSSGIDLSVVAIANFSGILAALVMTRLLPGAAGPVGTALCVGLAGLTALAGGAACGSLNGVLVARVGISPILAAFTQV